VYSLMLVMFIRLMVVWQ